MLSMPPAATTALSPVRICWAASATARRPEPQTWLIPNAVLASGSPAARAAWRAGFCPSPAASTWPRITSSTSPASTPARSNAACSASAPSVCAGSVPRAPLKLPTGVRAAETMTMSSMSGSPVGLSGLVAAPYPRSRRCESACRLWPCRREPAQYQPDRNAWGHVDDRGRAELRARRQQHSADRRDDRPELRANGRALGRPTGADRAPARHEVELQRTGRQGRRIRRRPARTRAATRRADRHLVAEQCRMGGDAVRHRQGGADPGEHQPGLSPGRAGVCAEQGGLPGADHGHRVQDLRLCRHDQHTWRRNSAMRGRATWTRRGSHR